MSFQEINGGGSELGFPHAQPQTVEQSASLDGGAADIVQSEGGGRS